MTPDRRFLLPMLVLTALARPLWPQNGPLAAVASKPLSRTVELPGEFLPFLTVSLHAKVPGYVERVTVDRGSVVKQGDPLVELSAPEMTAQIGEAEFKAQAAEAERLQAEAQLAAAESTYARMKTAAETPGAIAGNEFVRHLLFMIGDLVQRRRFQLPAIRCVGSTHDHRHHGRHGPQWWRRVG